MVSARILRVTQGNDGFFSQRRGLRKTRGEGRPRISVLPIMRRSSINQSTRRVLLNIVAAIFITQAAEAVEDAGKDGLEAYIGMAAERLIEDLGEPMLRTPHELWYSNGPEISGGYPGVPTPAFVAGRNGVTVNGAGGDYAPLYFSRKACDVRIKLGGTGLVEAVEALGPGCFEYVHRLQQQRAGRSSPP
jgi:hypothetical protein